MLEVPASRMITCGFLQILVVRSPWEAAAKTARPTARATTRMMKARALMRMHTSTGCSGLIPSLV